MQLQMKRAAAGGVSSKRSGAAAPRAVRRVVLVRAEAEKGAVAKVCFECMNATKFYPHVMRAESCVGAAHCAVHTIALTTHGGVALTLTPTTKNNKQVAEAITGLPTDEGMTGFKPFPEVRER